MAMFKLGLNVNLLVSTDNIAEDLGKRPDDVSEADAMAWCQRWKGLILTNFPPESSTAKAISAAKCSVEEIKSLRDQERA